MLFMKCHARTSCVYIGDASRTLLEKRLSEHKNAVKKHDTNNGLQPTLGGCRDKKRNVKKLLERRGLEPLTSINSSTPPT